ncbi:major facilitator superfamily-domain-containing protein [Xylariales sp. PMI_506]|nr:major facilitator superfamily-domain-containing protein [Xylariales sp. PMI_506]
MSLTKSVAPVEEIYPTVLEVQEDSEKGTLQDGNVTKEFEALPLSPVREIIFIVTVLMSQFLSQFGAGQTICIIYVIGADFGITSAQELTWLIAGFSLTVGSFVLLSGRLGDEFGYKVILIIGFSWFSLWSVVAGLSVFTTSPSLFIISRAFCGIGPALCLPNALAILGSSYPPGLKKSIIFSIFGGLAPIGFIAGGALAGVFAEFVWWPWTYWVSGIAAALVAVAGHITIPSPPEPTHAITAGRGKRPSFSETLWVLDLPAGILGIASLVLINFAWNEAVLAGWSAPYVLVCLVVGLLLVPAFFYIETRISPYPLIPFAVLTTDVVIVLGCIACVWGAYGIYSFYLWSTFLILHSTSPLLSVAWATPVIPVGLLAALGVGWLLSKKVQPSLLMVGAEVSVLIAMLLLNTSSPEQSYWTQLFPALIFAPLGLDMSFPAATLILSNAVGKEHQGVAMSLVNTIVNYSMSLSLGIAGTVEQQVLSRNRGDGDIVWKGYQAAEYVAIGLLCCGVTLSLVFVGKTFLGTGKRIIG